MSGRARDAVGLCVAIALTMAAALTVGAAEARADEPESVATAGAAGEGPKDVQAKRVIEPDTFWQATTLVYLQLGPTLFSLAPGLHLHHIYNRDDESVIWDKLYFRAGVTLPLSPAILGARVGVEWLPIAIFRIRAAYWALYHTGAELGIGHGMPFDTVEEPFDADTNRAREGEEESLFAHRFTIDGTLRLKVGPVALLSETELSGYLYPDAGYYYNSFYDNKIKRGELDGTLMNRTILVYEAWKGKGDAILRVGFVNQYVTSFDAGFERDRLGLVMVFTPWDELGGIDRPTLILAPGIALIDENREHEFWMEIAIRLAWDLYDD